MGICVNLRARLYTKNGENRREEETTIDITSECFKQTIVGWLRVVEGSKRV